MIGRLFDTSLWVAFGIALTYLAAATEIYLTGGMDVPGGILIYVRN